MNKQLFREYLSGGLSPEEKRNFEKRLDSDPEFREEFEDYKLIHQGLEVTDNYLGDHPDPETMSAFVFDRDKLGPRQIERVTAHLDKCPDCREMVEIGRKTAGSVPSVWDRIKSFLFVPRLKIAPALAAALVIILMAPLVYITGIAPDEDKFTADITLRSTARDVSVPPRLVIPSDQITTRFNFSIPYIDKYVYDVELMSPENDIILVYKNLFPQKTFAIEIPASYFETSGRYSLRVIEITPEGSEDIATFFVDIILE